MAVAEVHYKASDDISKFPCSLDQAQLWLRQGYFTSTTRFILRAADGKEGECTTLAQLIARNGQAMPFSEWSESEEDRKEHMAEVERMKEEMVELNERKERLQQMISQAKERQANVHNELNQIAQKFIIDASPVSVPPVSAISGVDPFALLARGQVKNKMKGTLATRFKELIAHFNRCDRKKLHQNTSGLFTEVDGLMCLLCKVKISSPCILVMHLCGERHVAAMRGVACADAFDFWWNAVDAVVETVASGDTVVADVVGLGSEEGGVARAIESKIELPPAKTVPSPNPTVAASTDISRSVQSKAKASFDSSEWAIPVVDQPPVPAYTLQKLAKAPKSVPTHLGKEKPQASGGQTKKKQSQPKPINLTGLALLQKTTMETNYQTPKRSILYALGTLYRKCDQQKLDEDPFVMRLFKKPLQCMICNEGSFSSGSQLVEHVLSNEHWNAVLREKCFLPPSAVGFWKGAAFRAAKSAPA